MNCLEALCGTQAAEDGWKPPWCDCAFSSLTSAFPIPKGQAGNQPWAIQAAQLWPKNTRAFHRDDFYPVQRGRAQKVLGPVGVCWCRQQSSWHGLGLQAAALSCEPKRWQGQSQHLAELEQTRGLHLFSTLSFCTREQTLKRELCARLMDQALILVHALTLEELRARCRSVFMYKCGICSLTHCERAPTRVYHRAQGAGRGTGAFTERQI